MCPLRQWSQRSRLFLKRENSLSPIVPRLKTALSKPETKNSLLISGATHTLLGNYTRRLFPINAVVLSLKAFRCLQELELAWITHIHTAVISVVFTERVHLAERGNFLSKALVSLGKTDEVMGHLTVFVSVLSCFKEKVLLNILYAAMRQKSTDFDSSYWLPMKSHERRDEGKHFPFTVRERDVCFQ